MLNPVPGIVGGAVIMVNANATVGKLDRIGFAEQDHSSPLKLPDRIGICSGNIFFQQACSGSRRQSFHVK